MSDLQPTNGGRVTWEQLVALVDKRDAKFDTWMRELDAKFDRYHRANADKIALLAQKFEQVPCKYHDEQLDRIEQTVAAISRDKVNWKLVATVAATVATLLGMDEIWHSAIKALGGP